MHGRLRWAGFLGPLVLVRLYLGCKRVGIHWLVNQGCQAHCLVQVVVIPIRNAQSENELHSTLVLGLDRLRGHGDRGKYRTIEGMDCPAGGEVRHLHCAKALFRVDGV